MHSVSNDLTKQWTNAQRKQWLNKAVNKCTALAITCHLIPFGKQLTTPTYVINIMNRLTLKEQTNNERMNRLTLKERTD